MTTKNLLMTAPAAGGGAAPTATQTDTFGHGSGTSFSATSLSLGTAASDRQIVVVISGRATGTTALTPTSVTVAGIAASLVTVAVENAGGNTTNLSLWAADVPTGTTGTVAYTFARSQLRGVGAVWAVFGAGATAADSAGTGTPATGVSMTATNGVAIACSGANNTSPPDLVGITNVGTSVTTNASATLGNESWDTTASITSTNAVVLVAATWEA